ncbi:MAG: alpha-D-ribose 1-methylphosphonate 5-triphosphate diphosphatase [Neomegalonema sp.]|nr:alpha-D-ribose 1-methylphosphonate 5-triphosphate diphosphatase [Neomegalonema sp.]
MTAQIQTDPAVLSDEIVLTNAHIVTREAVIDGSVLIRGGLIADVSAGRSTAAGAIDCEGDFVLPGLVELHTDNLERHLQPRPGVEWPRRAAVAAHDGEFVSVGVTTIFDALRVGTMSAESISDYAHEAAEAAQKLREHGLLKADHYIHLRCEICSPNLLPEFDNVGLDPRLRMISVMDHTPGQRQFAKEEKLREYYQGKKGMSDAQLDAFIAEAKRLQVEWAPGNLSALIERVGAAGHQIAIASHDDATQAHVEDSAGLGATIAEFPTTLEAARASRAKGMAILMGAPNVLRGFSHSGNVSAMDLAHEGLVDILSSDYAPASLMLAAFKMAEETDYTLPQAVATVSAIPAEVTGLTDRGVIAPGRKADLVRVYRAERLCVTRSAWRDGKRVA